MRPFVISLVLVITAPLVTVGTGCTGTRLRYYSDAQVDALSRLSPGHASRSDVVGILGNPTLPDALVPRSSAGAYSGCAFKTYWSKASKSGSSFVLLVVLDGDTYVGYQLWRWSFRASVPLENLNQASRLAAGTVNAETLRNILGTPASMMALPHGARCSYWFDIPAAIETSGVEWLSLDWVIDTCGNATFWCVKAFTNPTRFPRRGHGIPMLQEASPEQTALVRAYRARIADEMRRAPSGPALQTARAVQILSRLLPVAQPGRTNHVAVVVRVVQGGAHNACAHAEPGSKVISISTGLLEKLADDDELAFVIARELAHIALDHSYASPGFLRLPSQFQCFQNMEYEADMLALELMTNAGYDSAAADRVLDLLSKHEPSVPREISTHPPLQLRLAMLRWYRGFRGFHD